MKVLVTGHHGYIGSVMTRVLTEAGHAVTGLDTYLYEGCDFGRDAQNIPSIRKDVRDVAASDLRGFDAVIHLAALSNDPLGCLDESCTYSINYEGSVSLARATKAAGVPRFLFASSCSLYGKAGDEMLDENAAFNPITAYGRSKVMVEHDVAALADESFSPTYLRNATAYGASPRLRADIVVNNFVGIACTTREIVIQSDGTPWRPLVHGLDIARAIVCALNAPREAVHNQIFNVGDTTHNYTIKEIAEIVADVFPGCRLSFGEQSADQRSYRVSFDKIKDNLPGFRCEWDARRGAEQLHDLFALIDMSGEVFESRPFTRLKQLEYLIHTRQIDRDFFWRNGQPPDSAP